MSDSELILVALGGNAISLPDQQGDVAEQFANSARTAMFLADLVEQGAQLVITHGNGPQIGNFLLRNEVAAAHIYPLPMEVAVAHVQGGMGYMIAQTLTNELLRRAQERIVTTIITCVEVGIDDPAFENPTKPIGRVLNKKDTDRLAAEEGWAMKEIAPGKFRRVVPSPLPKRILEIDHIRRAIRAGELVVACGGGGIPVLRASNRDGAGGYKGIAAVIDKDLAGALLAAELDADAMLVLTNIDRVCINHGQSDEQPIDRMTVEQAQAWLDEGQFPPGSMGPKIRGAVNFLRASRKPHARVIIGPLDKAPEALAGRTGTTITGR